MAHKIEIVEYATGDWTKVYINGNLVYTGHGPYTDDWLEKILPAVADVEITWREAAEDESEWE